MIHMKQFMYLVIVVARYGHSVLEPTWESAFFGDNYLTYT